MQIVCLITQHGQSISHIFEMKYDYDMKQVTGRKAMDYNQYFTANGMLHQVHNKTV